MPLSKDEVLLFAIPNFDDLGKRCAIALQKVSKYAHNFIESRNRCVVIFSYYYQLIMDFFWQYYIPVPTFFQRQRPMPLTDSADEYRHTPNIPHLIKNGAVWPRSQALNRYKSHRTICRYFRHTLLMVLSDEK